MLNSRTVNNLYRKLNLQTPTPKTELLYNNNFQLLIAVILTAQTTDKIVNLVTPILFNKYPDPRSIIKGGEKNAFTFLNHLQLFHLAVSLGSTESLAEHPFSMTHADVPIIEKNALGLTDKMVRLSIGVENADDLIWDISQALDKIS